MPLTLAFLTVAATLTCDPARIAPDSYALTTRAQALIVTQKRMDWWDGFNVGHAFDALYDLNASSTFAAERARALDPHNLLASSLLARQYVVLGEDASRAEAAWNAVLDNGGAVVWTATLYDVDARSYFMVAFDRRGLRVYRFGEFASPFETRLGVPEWPGTGLRGTGLRGTGLPKLSEGDLSPAQDLSPAERFWRAWGGCIDAEARPEAVIPWSDVREIKAGNWVLWFKLTHAVTIRSDRGKKKDVDEIKVNLHGATGSIEVHTSVDPIDRRKVDVRTMGIGPLPYQERVRHTLVKLFDPEGRIKLPKASRSAGW